MVVDRIISFLAGAAGNTVGLIVGFLLFLSIGGEDSNNIDKPLSIGSIIFAGLGLIIMVVKWGAGMRQGHLLLSAFFLGPLMFYLIVFKLGHAIWPIVEKINHQVIFHPEHLLYGLFLSVIISGVLFLFVGFLNKIPAQKADSSNPTL